MELLLIHFFEPLNLNQMLLMRIYQLFRVNLYCFSSYLFEWGHFFVRVIDSHEFSFFFPIVECDLFIRHYIQLIIKPPHSRLYLQSYPHTNPHILPQNLLYFLFGDTIKVDGDVLIITSMNHHQPKRRNHPESKGSRRKEANFELTSDESREFAQEEVVWAKVVGHPWWPAVIAEKSYPTYRFDEGSKSLKRKEVTYRVSFFGEASHAFLEQSKIAQYLPNRDYFIEQALKQSKRFNMDAFRASVRHADIMSDNPQVGEMPQVLMTPRKERGNVEDERTAVREQSGENGVEKQKTTCRAIKIINETQKKEIGLSFRFTSTHKKISQTIFKRLKELNANKYTLATLKTAVIRAMKKEKCLKKLDCKNPEQPLNWMKKILAMGIDEIIQGYCKKSQIGRQAPLTPTTPPPQERKYSLFASSLTKPFTYTYIDALGNKSTRSEALQTFDFYIPQ